MNFSIQDIPYICAAHGVEHVIICPGSRSAPLTLAFARFDKIEKTVVADERSAAFIALGIAESSKKPTVLICTSGTAVYNFAPAVAEAFFKNIPLIILTADRPPEWIGQQDGQTIFQENIFQNHVKKSAQLPVDLNIEENKWLANRLINESLILTNQYPKGPIHLNIPLREPLYNGGEQSANPRIIQNFNLDNNINLENLFHKLNEFNKVILVFGQNYYAESQEYIQNISKKFVVIGDLQANIHSSENIIKYHDTFLSLPKENLKSLEPELVITFGNSILSKSLKNFLRNSADLSHWHVQETTIAADTFKKLSLHINCSTELFINELYKNNFSKNTAYFDEWQSLNLASKKAIEKHIENTAFSEIKVVHETLENINENHVLHLANSMSIRYANLLSINKKISVFSNRGTSGIDGCTSTMLGHALENPQKQHILITGDIAFFYDRNAFWFKKLPQNFKIIILNNQAGAIFRLLDGSKQQSELEEYFESPHEISAENLCKDYGIQYLQSNDLLDFNSKINTILNSPQAGILEVMIDKYENVEIFSKFKQEVNQTLLNN